MNRLEQLELEREFIESWNHAYRFFSEYAREHQRHYDEHPDELPAFIARVENDLWQDYRNWPAIQRFFATAACRECNRVLRAGTSLFTFIVSRSLDYGLRDDQPYISIFFAHDKISGFHNLDGGDVKFTADIGFTDEIDELFQRLIERPLD